MILTAEQQAGMLEAAKPLMKWISENGDFHTTAIVDIASVEVTQEVARGITQEFIEG